MTRLSLIAVLLLSSFASALAAPPTGIKKSERVTRVVRDADDRIRYHYVLIDYVAFVATDVVCAGSDAGEAMWAPIDEVKNLDVTDGLIDMIERALKVAGPRAYAQGGSSR